MDRLKEEQTDIKQEKFSYTKIDRFDSCGYSYKLRYVDGNYPKEESLPLAIGELLHEIYEYIGQQIINKSIIDKSLILEFLHNAGQEGVSLLDKKSDEGKPLSKSQGINTLKELFADDYSKVSEKSKLNMDDKIKNFEKNLDKIINSLKEDKEWEVFKVEYPFEFTYEGIKFFGFIDRIDKNKHTGELRVIDYKTKDTPFRDETLPTPLQFIVYALGIQQEFGVLPSEYIYDLILLDKKQYGCTKGYFERGKRKLTNLIAKINREEFYPKPSPLCHWCPYSQTNPNANPEFVSLCPYYSLWTPKNNIYTVNKKYGEGFSFTF